MAVGSGRAGEPGRPTRCPEWPGMSVQARSRIEAWAMGLQRGSKHGHGLESLSLQDLGQPRRLVQESDAGGDPDARPAHSRRQRDRVLDPRPAGMDRSPWLLLVAEPFHLGRHSRQALARASGAVPLHRRFDEVPVVRRGAVARARLHETDRASRGPHVGAAERRLQTTRCHARVGRACRGRAPSRCGRPTLPCRRQGTENPPGVPRLPLPRSQ